MRASHEPARYRLRDWLVANGHLEVHLVASGWGAVPGTFAALLSGAVVQVTLKHALTSYAAIAESEDYNWPLSAFLPGVLKNFDLPDCYRALAAKKLRQIAPCGPREGGVGANAAQDAGHEIAVRLGISEHTVDAQLTKALHRCREFFAEHGGPPLKKDHDVA